MDIANADDHLQLMFKDLPVGVAILQGPDLVYFRINEMLANLNGIPVEDHLGRPLLEVLPDSKDNLLPVMHEILRTGEPVLGRKFSIALPKDPETSVDLVDYLFPIFGADGNPSGIGAVVIDVTARKRHHESTGAAPVDTE